MARSRTQRVRPELVRKTEPQTEGTAGAEHRGYGRSMHHNTEGTAGACGAVMDSPASKQLKSWHSCVARALAADEHADEDPGEDPGEDPSASASGDANLRRFQINAPILRANHSHKRRLWTLWRKCGCRAHSRLNHGGNDGDND